MRDNGAVRVKAVYLALGIKLDGEKELLGIWIAQTESAKFWLQVVTELKNRGVQDIFIACVGGLKGFPEAIEAVFPQTAVQLADGKSVNAQVDKAMARRNAGHKPAPNHPWRNTTVGKSANDGRCATT